MRSRVMYVAPSLLGLIGVALPSVGFAQPAAPAVEADNGAGTGEIIVTAQRRSEKQVDVPITITALGPQQLATANIQALPDIVKLTPALRFDNAGGYFQPTIRGVGTPVVTSGGGSNVGIYIDGFYSPNPLAADFQLTRVESVDVLKGPQGTLFGRNTTGGAILVTTADPSTTPGVEAKFSFGRYDELREQAYATFGLAKNVAMDIEGSNSSGNGYLTNISNGKRVGDWHDWSVRTGLKIELSPDVSVLLRYQHSYTSDPTPLLTASYYDPVFGSGAPAAALPGQYTFNPSQVAAGTAPQQQQYLVMKSDVFQGTIKADLGFANLTSYSQYRKESVAQLVTIDYASLASFDLLLPTRNATWSQEFLLTSKPGSRLQWTAGLFGFGNTDPFITYAASAGGFVYASPLYIGGSGTNTLSFAGFVDGTYALSSKLFLTAGVRVAHDEVIDAYYNPNLFSGGDPTQRNPLPSIHSNHATPRVVIRYKPDDHSSLYASFTKGYKAAIIDAGGSCQNGAHPVCNNVKPENITSYELGYKFDSRRATLDVSGFYYDYKNLQVSEFLAGQAIILNAARSRIYGIDAQASIPLTDRLEVTGSGAWTHARYLDFTQAPVYLRCTDYPAAACAAGSTFFLPPQGGVPGVTLTNVTMQRAPAYTATAGLRYKADVAGGKLVLSSNLYFSSKLYYGPSGIQFPQNSYALLSLRAAWTDPSAHYTVALYGDNVTNKRYITEVQASTDGVGANWNKPATYGVQFGAKF